MFGLFGGTRAIKRLARCLPRQLYADYGASEFYTPGQIRTAIAKLKINPAYSQYGYAMFLPEDAYLSLGAQFAGLPLYQDARAEFLRHAPRRVLKFDNSFGASPDSSLIYAAGSDTYDSGHGGGN